MDRVKLIDRGDALVRGMRPDYFAWSVSAGGPLKPSATMCSSKVGWIGFGDVNPFDSWGRRLAGGAEWNDRRGGVASRPAEEITARRR